MGVDRTLFAKNNWFSLLEIRCRYIKYWTVSNNSNNLESKIKKIYVDKLETIPIDLKSLRDVVY